VPQLIESLDNLIRSETFCDKHKQKPKNFTRNRLFPFNALITFLLNMNNKSYQSELDTYFKAINHSEVAERILFKGNLSKARAKLKFDAFTELNDYMVRYFYQHFPFQTWH